MDYEHLSVSDGSGDAPLMHITATRVVGATTINVDTVNGLPDKFIATSGTLLPSGFIDPTTKCDFAGHVSGNNIVIDAFLGSSDSGHSEGQVIVIKPSTPWANKIAQFIKNVAGFGTPEGGFFSKLTLLAGLTVQDGPVKFPRQSIDGGSLNVTKSKDINGWTVWDFGAYKEYAKTITFNASVPGNATVNTSTGNLPAGFSTLADFGAFGVDYYAWYNHSGQSTEQVGHGMTQMQPAKNTIELWYRNINASTLAAAFTDTIFIRK